MTKNLTCIRLKNFTEARLTALHAELAELRQRRQQQEIEIVNIENVKLKQRFQEILDNLLTKEMQKVQEVIKPNSLVYLSIYIILIRITQINVTNYRFVFQIQDLELE